MYYVRRLKQPKARNHGMKNTHVKLCDLQHCDVLLERIANAESTEKIVGVHNDLLCQSVD